jgi:hypothetical protein
VTLFSAGDVNSYYPVFLEDDKLAYVIGTKPQNLGEKPKFYIRLASLQPMTPPNCPDCYSVNLQTGQLAAMVGALRMKRCDEDPKFYLKNAVSSFSQISPSQCHQLVNQCDESCLEATKTSIQRDSDTRVGISVGGVSYKSTQFWNQSKVRSFAKKDLSSFCDSFVRANSATPNPTVNGTK